MNNLFVYELNIYWTSWPENCMGIFTLVLLAYLLCFNPLKFLFISF